MYCGLSGTGIPLTEIISAVYDEYGIPFSRIQSRSRTGEVVEPRHVIAYLVARHGQLKKREIGNALLRHHASIIHSEKTIDAWYHNDARFRPRLMRIKKQLGLIAP